MEREALAWKEVQLSAEKQALKRDHQQNHQKLVLYGPLSSDRLLVDAVTPTTC